MSARGMVNLIAIEEKEIADTKEFYYILNSIGTDRQFWVLVYNAEILGLGPILSEPEIYVVLEILNLDIFHAPKQSVCYHPHPSSGAFTKLLFFEWQNENPPYLR